MLKSKTKKAILLFPPNWSAIVSGPHLAMPLLAGVAKRLGWESETWDLSEAFYRTYAAPPTRYAVEKAAKNGSFVKLDQLYFDWEDQLRSHQETGKFGSDFGLLS